jgi:SAM-dependent methyltransferase
MQDKTYQDRYTERTQKKIEAILEAFDPTGKRCLDIGCNRGELCRALKTYGAAAITGIDLEDVTHEYLRSFEFLEGDVAQIELPQVDVTFCLSVLHHIAGYHGMDTYKATLRKVLQSAPIVFLEVATASEVGSYYWKDEILKHYPTDGEWLNTIMDHPLVAKWSIVTTLPIHQAFRHVFKIETVQPKTP